MARRLRFVAFATMGSLLLAAFAAGPTAVAAGNGDAAHACQKDGYATLQGSDGTTFANTGACVAYVAKGGTISGVSTACSFVSGTSGCFELDSVRVYLGTSGSGTSWTTLSGMVSFAPVVNWDYFTATTISGSGTWITSTGVSGTWTATDKSSIYPTTFGLQAGGFTTCAAADTRYVGVHLVLAGGGIPSDAVMELGLRDATWGTNGLSYQGFSATSFGEPLGIHTTTDVSGVTVRC